MNFLALVLAGICSQAWAGWPNTNGPVTTVSGSFSIVQSYLSYTIVPTDNGPLRTAGGTMTFNFTSTGSVTWGRYSASHNEIWIQVPSGVTVTLVSVQTTTPEAPGAVGSDYGMELNPNIPTRQGFVPLPAGDNRYLPALSVYVPVIAVGNGQNVTINGVSAPLQSLLVAKRFINGAPAVINANYGHLNHTDSMDSVTFIGGSALPPCNGACTLRPSIAGPLNAKSHVDLRNFFIDKITATQPVPNWGLDPDSVYLSACRTSRTDYFSPTFAGESIMPGPNTYGAYMASAMTLASAIAMDPARTWSQRQRFLGCILQRGQDVYVGTAFGSNGYGSGGGHPHGRSLPLAAFTLASMDPAVIMHTWAWAKPRASTSLFDMPILSTPYGPVDLGLGEFMYLYKVASTPSCWASVFWGTVTEMPAAPYLIDGTSQSYFYTIVSASTALAWWAEMIEQPMGATDLLGSDFLEFTRRYAKFGRINPGMTWQAILPGPNSTASQYDGQIDSRITSAYRQKWMASPWAPPCL